MLPALTFASRPGGERAESVAVTRDDHVRLVAVALVGNDAAGKDVARVAAVSRGVVRSGPRGREASCRQAEKENGCRGIGHDVFLSLAYLTATTRS